MKIERSYGGRKSAKHRFWGVFPKDLNDSDALVFHPLDDCLVSWNKSFVICCMIALCVDPFLLFFPSIRRSECVAVNMEFAITITFLRTAVDAFYLIHMYFQFHTAFKRNVMGTTKLVTDPTCIATKYWRGLFVVDLLSVLPFPQIAILACFLDDTVTPTAMKAVLAIVFLQYAPRFLRVYPLTVELQKTAGAFPNSSLAGAVYYLLWYLLVSHILGSSWYLLGVERNFSCLKKACSDSKLCDEAYLYCFYQQRQGSFSSTKMIENVSNSCSMSAENPPVTFGIYKEALTNGVFRTSNFLSLYLYCFWWGIKNLSTLGQGLQTDIYAGEIIFTVSITISGVLHAAYLIGNMHSYLKSFTTRLEELRNKKYEMEQWMHRRLLPQDLRQRVGRYNQYRWWETGGMDEETLLQSLPRDIRRDVKRHLCMDMIKKMKVSFKRYLLVPTVTSKVISDSPFSKQYLQILMFHKLSTMRNWKPSDNNNNHHEVHLLKMGISASVADTLLYPKLFMVPIFGQMDDQFLDAFCERLKSSLYTEGAYIVQEGDPVNDLVFITHGVLESITTDAGRSEFINQSVLKEGDFCGEELLPWALDPQIGSILPTSTRLVQALTEVEAFTMTPENLKFLARQFKCLHTQQAKHLFRFYSQHWRIWAACCIQRAWRRYSERKRALNRHRESCSLSLTSTLYAFRFIHILRGRELEKPREPDFTSESD